MCPVKEQNSITFLITSLGNGFVVFTNIELGLSFPFYIGDQNQTNGLIRMKFIRVSFPKFVSRLPMYQQATIYNDSIAHPLEISENIDAIAHRTLKDRMKKELGEVLLRMALKKLAEIEASQQNQGLGVLVNIANTVSEQADTRNWQLLPYSINYSRVVLNTNQQNNISFTITTNNNELMADSLKITTDSLNKTFFYSYTSPTSF